jgi:carbonic anhydrase
MKALTPWLPRALAGALLAAILGLTARTPSAAEPAPPTALARLRAGNERFVKEALAAVPLGPATRKGVASGPPPFAMVLSCADSSVPPEYIFNTGLGDLFVVRAAGEVVDKAVMASLEYGIDHLHVPLLVVMGHDACGVVKAALDTEHGDGPNLGYLLTRIRAGLQHGPADQLDLRTAILANVEQVINDAMAGSALLRAAASGGRLQIVGAYYEAGSGRVVFSDPIDGPTAAHK